MSYSGRKRGRNDARTKSPAMDRRLACRYPATIKDLVLSTVESGSQADHSVQLQNISMHGCLVKTRHDPGMQPGQRVLLRLLEDSASPVIDGIVVSNVKPFLGKRSIQIQFLAPLPYQTFKMLVYGTEGFDMNLRNRPEQETDQFWK